MSLIHWDKSVLSFHLKEIIEDHESGDQQALVGLGAILAGTIVIPTMATMGRPVLKAVIKSWLSLTDVDEVNTKITSNNQPNLQDTPSSESTKIVSK